MEAATARAPDHPRKPLRQRVLASGLYAALLAPIVIYGILDLTNDDPARPNTLARLGNTLISGLSDGAIIALVALGYTLVYGIIELINFAHGDVFMLGTLTTVAMFGVLGLDGAGTVPIIFGILLTMVVAMLVCGTLNVMIERVGYRPLRSAPKLAPLITAVGFSFVLQNVGILWIGPSQKSTVDLISKDSELFSFLGLIVSRADALAIAVTVPLVFLLTAFIANSRLGKAMRATAQDPEAARLMGINVDTTVSVTFLLGGLLAGAAGTVQILYATREWYFEGFQFGLFAFTAAVMGGIGNLRGAVLGGLIIGVFAQMTDNRLGNQWQTTVVFAFLIIVMVFRPQGLIGEQTREAG
jgi:branched-chain amino acid transport system permease protein